MSSKSVSVADSSVDGKMSSTDGHVRVKFGKIESPHEVIQAAKLSMNTISMITIVCDTYFFLCCFLVGFTVGNPTTSRDHKSHNHSSQPTEQSLPLPSKVISKTDASGVTVTVNSPGSYVDDKGVTVVNTGGFTTLKPNDPKGDAKFHNSRREYRQFLRIVC